MKQILLNPGPANTTDTVKRAMLADDICPREHEFGDVMERVADGLVRVVHPGKDYVAVLIGGSGTAGVEAAVATAVPSDGRLLVVDNGAYGARIADIAAQYEMPHHALRFGVGGAVDLDQVESALARERFTHVAIVHHETTTGMLNPVDAVARLARARGADVIVDAMSSYAGMPIDVAAMGADYLVSSSNKCVQGMAGLAFVIARRDKLERLESRRGRSTYLDLAAQHRFFLKAHQMRFTPPVQIVYALDQALTELFAEGVEARWRRYLACFEAIDGGVRALGFRRLLPSNQLSRILTAYLEPDHAAYGYDAMHDQLRRRGYTIYPGKGAKQATFRLANMGAVTVDDMRGFVAALRETIEVMGLNPLYGPDVPGEPA
jgi:2-aminoethylphosphonate-pyruvate transaminase